MPETNSYPDMPDDIKAVLDEAYNNVCEEDARYRRHMDRAKRIAVYGIEFALGGVGIKVTGLLSDTANTMVIGGLGTLVSGGFYAADAYFRHDERIAHVDLSTE